VSVETVGATQAQTKTGNWTIVEANVEAVTEHGEVWPNSVVFEHTSSISVLGMTTVETEELSITSLDGPGLVWADVLTTTSGGTSESFTELISAE